MITPLYIRSFVKAFICILMVGFTTFIQVELKEFVKVGCDIYKVPKASEDEEDNGKPFRRISNKQVNNGICM